MKIFGLFYSININADKKRSLGSFEFFNSIHNNFKLEHNETKEKVSFLDILFKNDNVVNKLASYSDMKKRLAHLECIKDKMGSEINEQLSLELKLLNAEKEYISKVEADEKINKNDFDERIKKVTNGISKYGKHLDKYTKLAMSFMDVGSFDKDVQEMNQYLVDLFNLKENGNPVVHFKDSIIQFVETNVSYITTIDHETKKNTLVIDITNEFLDKVDYIVIQEDNIFNISNEYKYEYKQDDEIDKIKEKIVDLCKMVGISLPKELEKIPELNKNNIANNFRLVKTKLDNKSVFVIDVSNIQNIKEILRNKIKKIKIEYELV